MEATSINDYKKPLHYLLSTTVIVAALGYFVDIYDLLLFGIVRLPSLTELGLNEQARSIEGASILNWQMSGLLIGGIIWGILGLNAAAIVGVICFAIGFYSILTIPETHHKDLDFIQQ